jgi:hypothetical protein
MRLRDVILWFAEHPTAVVIVTGVPIFVIILLHLIGVIH